MLDLHVLDPVVVDNRGDIQIYPTKEEAQSEMEEIDVENDEFEVHDSIGNRLDLYCNSGSVIARAVAGRPPEPEVLAQKLRGFLDRVGVEVAPGTALTELVELCRGPSWHEASRAIRVRIEYEDQNEPFAAHLPRDGTIVRALKSTSGQVWHQVALDNPIDYQLHGPAGFRRVLTDQVLVTPRVVDARIGTSKPARVGLYLAEESQLPLAAPLKMEDFIPACWATCRRLRWWQKRSEKPE